MIFLDAYATGTQQQVRNSYETITRQGGLRFRDFSTIGDEVPKNDGLSFGRATDSRLR